MRRILVPAVLALAACAAGAWLLYVRANPGGARTLADVPPMSTAEALAQRADGYRGIGSIEDVLALPGHFARMEALYALAGRSDSAGVQNLIFQAHTIADASDRRDILLVLFARLAELDPLSALALCRTPSFRADPRLEHEVWQRWGGYDLDAALAHAATLAGTQRMRAAQALFAAHDHWGTAEAERIVERLGVEPDNRTRSAHLDDLAATDPAAAVGYVQGLDSALHRRQAAAHLGRVLGRAGLDAADRWAARFEDPALRRAFEDAAAQAAAEIDPEGTLERLLADRSPGARTRLVSAFTAVAAADVNQALAWFERIEDRRQRLLVGRTIAIELARSDPVAALAWAQEHDRGAERHLYTMVLATIAESDPELAIQSAKSLGDRGQRRSALASIAHRVAQQDPRRAVELVDDIEDRGLRNLVAQTVAMNWLQADPDAALDWLLTADLANREELLASAAHYLPRYDVEAAIALLPRLGEDAATVWRQQIAAGLALEGSTARARAFIAQYESTPEYPQLLAGLVSGLAESDPPAAVATLGELADHPQGRMLASMVFMQYANKAPREAADAAVAYGDTELRPQVLSSVLGHWVRSDPEAAEEWVMRLPAGPERESAVGAVAGSWDELTPARRRLLESIEDPAQRKSATMNAVFAIARRDRDSAEQALRSLDMPEADREQLLQLLDNFEEQRANPYVIRSW